MAAAAAPRSELRHTLGSIARVVDLTPPTHESLSLYLSLDAATARFVDSVGSVGADDAAWEASRSPSIECTGLSGGSRSSATETLKGTSNGEYLF